MLKTFAALVIVLVWLEHAQAVYPCYPETCPPGYYFHPVQCKCKKICTITCNPPKIKNFATCKCVCPYCAPPKGQKPTTCECKCPHIYCAPPKVFDPTTCKCKCPYVYCPYPKIVDPHTCLVPHLYQPFG